ncbi:MAG: hypothetical protein ABIE07_09440 [Candidatus Zixiibacteriota bacterium]
MNEQERMKFGLSVFFLSALITFLIVDIIRGLPALTALFYLLFEKKGTGYDSKMTWFTRFCLMGILYVIYSSVKVLFGPITRRLDALTARTKSRRAVNRALHELGGHTPIKFSINDLSSSIPIIAKGPPLLVYNGAGGHKWHGFKYAQTTSQGKFTMARGPLFANFLADSESTPIYRIHVELDYTKARRLRKRTILPICVDQAAIVINAIMDISQDNFEKIQSWLGEVRPYRDNNNRLDTMDFTLKIYANEYWEERSDILAIWSTKK